MADVRISGLVSDALDEVPEDVRISARMVLDAPSARRVNNLLERPPRPTAAMRKLFGDRRNSRA